MGDPITVALMVGGTAISAYGQMQAGKAQAQAAEFERAQYEEQRQLAQVQALDEESQRRKRLNQVLSSNRAAAAGAGIQTDGSRSFLAIQKDSANEAERDIGRIRLNAASTNRSYMLQEQQSSLAGKSARSSGFIGAAGTILGGGYQLRRDSTTKG